MDISACQQADHSGWPPIGALGVSNCVWDGLCCSSECCLRNTLILQAQAQVRAQRRASTLSVCLAAEGDELWSVLNSSGLSL